MCLCWSEVVWQFTHFFSDWRRPTVKVKQNQLRRFMNPYVKLWMLLRFFWSQESCGLDFGVGERLEKEQALFRWARSAADPIDASLIACASSLFSCLSSPGGETGFFIWIVTVRKGFGEVLVSCCLTQFGRITTLCTLLHEASEVRGSFWVHVHQNAVVVCRCQGNACVIYSRCNSEWHFFQKIAPEHTCHVCLHMNNPSLLMPVHYVSDDSPNCWTIYRLYCMQDGKDCPFIQYYYLNSRKKVKALMSEPHVPLIHSSHTSGQQVFSHF